MTSQSHLEAGLHMLCGLWTMQATVTRRSRTGVLCSATESHHMGIKEAGIH
jgi:hypothetical protein